MSFEKNIANYFKFEEKGATLTGELRAGLTTFLTMAYILLVNPAMLAVEEYRLMMHYLQLLSQPLLVV